MNIKIDPKSNQPIYKQIVEYIESEIENGNIPAQTKLPTFRTLSETLGVSLGTVKRAYDDLYRNGSIIMTQGRGSFVAPDSTLQPSSKKDQAMLIIDEALDQLKNIPISTHEIRIFFDLKLRSLEHDKPYIKLAIIDCNIEALLMIESKFSSIDNIDVKLFLLDDFLKTKNPDADLYITTFTHYSVVNEAIENPEKLMGIVMSTSVETVVQISKLRSQDNIGIITFSPTFAKLVTRGVNQFSDFKNSIPTFLLQSENDLREFILNKDILIVPKSFHRIASKEQIDIISGLPVGAKEIIYYDYETDGGSFVYISDKIDEIIAKSMI